MEKTKFAILIVGYNRIKSMLRTIESVCKAYYGEDTVDLIISIDHSENDEIISAANGVTWNYGRKIVRYLPSRIGLKNHILSCGDYLEEYDALAILEDDIIVSPSFFSYMKAAVREYESDQNIAGISLYSFGWNPIFNAPFYPQMTDKDTYFIQFAQSWGQIWMKNQWNEFKQWYLENTDIFDKEYDGMIPKAVYDWPKTSWLKYHIRYCVEKNKYFVYPYISLSTNSGECGEHYDAISTRHQVPLQSIVKKKYEFASFSDGLKYDVYFENQSMSERLQVGKNELIVDIYGNKPIEKMKCEYHKYLLSSQIFDYEIVKSYALSMRPQEDNIVYGINGDSIFLYNLGIDRKNKVNKRKHIVCKWNYYTKERFVMLEEIVPVFMEKIRNMLKGLLK